MISQRNVSVPPPLDAELAAPLAQILSGRPPSLLPSGIADDRVRSRIHTLSTSELTLDGVFVVNYETIPTTDATSEIGLVIMTPTCRREPVPVILSIHGGGLVAGDYRSRELVPELRRAAELRMAVVSVGYRLAPEHPHPMPVEDCYAALLWIARQAKLRHFDPESIFVSGVSAGGALAAALALLARDRNGPKLNGQILLFPMLDDRVSTLSAEQMTKHGLWDSVSNITGWSALLGDTRGGPDVSYYAAPARADDLSELPPTYIDVGAYESLRDEALDYAARLANAGVDVEFHMWGGAFHSFDEWVPDALVSRTAHLARIAWMQRHLHR